MRTAYKSASTYYIQRMAYNDLGMHLIFDSPVAAGECSVEIPYPVFVKSIYIRTVVK